MAGQAVRSCESGMKRQAKKTQDGGRARRRPVLVAEALSPRRPVSIAEALSAARETRQLELGPGSLAKTAEVFRKQFGEKPALIVADTNTFAAAGRTVLEYFRGAGQVAPETFIFTEPNLYAEYAFVAKLENCLRARECIPVAVGSGTINDLTKLAAHRVGRPYMAVATAASMDGYTAFGASITFEASKQTFTCPAPQAVVADLDIIRAAPAGMNASGYADLVAKTTAGADWLIADALEVEPLNAKAWDIVQGGLREAVANPAGVRQSEPAALERLTEGLMLGGFAMQRAQSSRPASGAEHQFSHLWDMQHHTHNGQTPSHGFKVGIGTLAMTALYEFLLAQKLEALDAEECAGRWPEPAALEKAARSLFPEDKLAGVAIQESRAKWSAPPALRKQLQQLQSRWPELRERLKRQLISFADLKMMLRAAGAAVEPEQIGLSRERLRESFRQAYYIRRRFTVLDLAVRCGLLEPALEHLFGPNGPWALNARRQNREPQKVKSEIMGAN
jgi:glycerol-1-phosphate dehydrogenase [NAD(P)+]